MSVSEEVLDVAASLIARGDVMVLSGAGLSTESGIPDYRGPSGQRRGGTPMTYLEFTRSSSARQRYWARSHRGWRAVADAHPNVGHFAVATLERVGLLSGVVTQNVDGLHQRAGASDVVELHGNLAAVVCLTCGVRSSRTELDDRLHLLNLDPSPDGSQQLPDGDAVVGEDDIEAFSLADCANCGGVLKPDVVFFGESVPRARVRHCFDILESSATLLVLGSSLTVMSGYRFALRAAELAIPVVIVNQGATRADELATCRIDAPLGRTLPHLAAIASRAQR